uniref:LolA-like domain-containing protein n=1 Tax=Strigamia maritima TaxID=126957 RepID=T1IGS1_STRMM
MILTTFLLFIVSLRFIQCDNSPPNLADVFGVDLEINVYSYYPDQRVTSLVDLEYDKYRNQIALKILSIGNLEHIIIDFNSSQIFTFDHAENEFGCKSDKCTDESDSVCRVELDGLFPQMSALNLSFSQIFPGIELLGQSPSKPATFKGTTVWENIKVDEWISVYEYTTTTTHWTTKNWTTPIDASWGSVPILVQMTFELRKDDVSKTQQQIALNHYEPRDKSEDDLFQPQEGVYCSEWKSTKKFPANINSNNFYFKTEGIGEQTKSVTWSDEWFDLDNGLVRIDYQSYIENVTLTKIVDYTENKVFEIRSDGCRSREGTDMLMEIGDSPSVISLLKPLKSLNDFYGNADYKYIGKRHSTREVESFVWQGIRSHRIGESRVKALWEWYFDKHNSDYIPTRRSFKVISIDKPGLRRDPKVDVNSGDKIVHQIYGFEHAPTGGFSEMFDVVSCYTPRQIQHLQFEIKDKSENDDRFRIQLVSQPRFRFKWRQLLAKEAGIALLRISELKCVMLHSKFYVQFKLLKQNQNIDEFQKIEKKIDNGGFGVQFEKWSFAAVPKSLTTAIATVCPLSTTPQPSTSPRTTETIVTQSPPTTKKPSTAEPSGLKSKGLATGVGIGSFLLGVNSGLTIAFFLQDKLLRYF